MAVPIRYHQHVFTTWQELCSIFVPRRPLAPRLEEFVPSILKWDFDQLTWHCRNNISWQDATERMEPLSTSELRVLSKLSNDNLIYHKRAYYFFVFILGFSLSTIMFGYGIIKDIINYKIPGADLFQFLFDETFILWSIGIIFLALFFLFFKNLNSLLRARELSSCIHVMLSLREVSISREHS